MSDFFALHIAESGLIAHSRAIEVTGQNITNANTPGYHRQTAELEGLGSPVIPAIFSRWDRGGAGVDVASISRARDTFLEARSLAEQGNSAGLQRLQNVYNQIETTFPEPSDTGISKQLANFWSAWQDAANQPDSLGVRQQLLDSANTVAQSFHQAATELTNLRNSSIDDLNAQVTQVNNLASRIAELNAAIKKATAGGLQPNDLMDQRDQTLSDLTQLVGVTTQERSDGSTDVFLGGSTLVSGTTAMSLKVDTSTVPAAGTPDALTGFKQIVVRWSGDNSAAAMTSGKIWALDQGINQVVPKYLDQLNQAAAKLVSDVNTVHASGYGLNDPQQPAAAPGRNFFAPIAAAPPYPAMAIGLDPAVANAPANIALSNGTGVRDVSVGQQISQLQSSTSGVDAMYKQMIGSLGVDSQSVQQRSTIQDALTQQVLGARDSVSGVNIDEEMINLVQSQHAYDASARVMTAIDTMLDTLIKSTGLVGR